MKKSIFVTLAICFISFTLSSAHAQAAAGSWLQQPTWANNDNDNAQAAPQKRSVRREIYNANISPFAPGSNNLAIDVGQVFLMGDTGGNYSDNLGAQLHYTYGVSDLFSFDSSLGYSEHSDGAYSMTTLVTGLRTNLAWYDKVVPYLTFGLGFYKPSMTLTNGSNTATLSPMLFGLHIGPGVDLELTKQLFFGAALTFHDVFGSTKPNPVGGAPVNVGGTFSTFFLHAGVTF